MTATLTSALVAAQAEMPKVEKRGRNPHFKNEYVTLDDLIDSVRPVLNRHGLAIVQPPATLDGNMPALKTILLHGPSGETLESTMPLILQKGDMQGVGSAITYGRRYMLAAMLGIAEGVDDDGNHASASPRPEQAAQPADRPSAAAPPPPDDGTFKAPDSGPTITDAQIKKLWATWRETKLPDAVLRDTIERMFGAASTKQIPKARFNELLDEIKQLETVPF